MIVSIIKRDGRVVPFDPAKIEQAIEKCFAASGSRKGRETAGQLAQLAITAVENDESVPSVPTVEQVQDAVERTLIGQGFARSAKAYILYRAERSRVRAMSTHLMKTFEDICTPRDADGETPMGAMLKFGSEGAKQFYEMFVIDPKFAQAHHDGDFYIHDLEYYALTTASTQIDLPALFQGGFSTGSGTLREPQDIASYAALCCLAIQANQNDQYGCQSIANFDTAMAPGVGKTYEKRFRENLSRALELMLQVDDAAEQAKTLLSALEAETGKRPMLAADAAYDKALKKKLQTLGKLPADALESMTDFIRGHAERETDKATHEAMEALVHNLNALHSRAGAQPPFSAVNYGTDTSPEARMAMRNLLITTEEGIGSGVSPLYPVQFFRVKEGVNYNPGDPNYDLFRLAIRVSAKRLYPRFSFLDAPFNLQFYRPGRPETEAAYMGGNTRVLGNVHDPAHDAPPRRGNLFAVSVNLPRIGINAKGDVTWFYEELARVLTLAAAQLTERFERIAAKPARSYPFLMGQDVWLGSEALAPDESIREVLKHGTLAIGFTGLCETLVALRGTHHGENTASQNLGLEIVGFIRRFCDEQSAQTGLNFTCLATPPEGLAGRFVRLDRERFGTRKGVTDQECYTNSFHIPARFPLSAFEKISLEAPYHALTNGGHLSTIGTDAAPAEALDALEQLLRHMHDADIGCGSVYVNGTE